MSLALSRKSFLSGVASVALAPVVAGADVLTPAAVVGKSVVPHSVVRYGGAPICDEDLMELLSDDYSILKAAKVGAKVIGEMIRNRFAKGGFLGEGLPKATCDSFHGRAGLRFYLSDPEYW